MDLAKAELAENRNPSLAVRKIAALSDSDAEKGVHSIFKEFNLVPPVEISQVDLGAAGLHNFPVIKFQQWALFLLDSGLLWKQLCGCNTFSKMTAVLQEFWGRMQEIHPNHSIFKLAADGTVDLCHTIPVFSHTDEGRSLKKSPILLISTHGVLGRGTRAFLKSRKHQAVLSRNSMGMNFTNHPMASHFVFASMLKSVSDKNPAVLESLIAAYGADMKTMLLEGVTSTDMTMQCWFCHLGTKGDLPALNKVGRFQRTFLRAPKAKASRKPCSGICHLCLAGKEVVTPASNNHSPYPFEDLSPQPAWIATLNQEDPWDQCPEILDGAMVQDPACPATFFCVDLWHCFHLGLAKHWIASSLVSVVELFDFPPEHASSVEKRFEWVNLQYQQFRRDVERSGWVKQIDRDLCNFPSSTICPIGSWNKGSTSTHLMKFLEWFCTGFITGKTNDEVLKAVVLLLID